MNFLEPADKCYLIYTKLQHNHCYCHSLLYLKLIIIVAWRDIELIVGQFETWPIDELDSLSI